MEYKRLRPGCGVHTADLALFGQLQLVVPALNVEEANDQLLNFEIAESKRTLHNNAATVQALLVHAKEQVLAYARELCSMPKYAGFKCNTGVVIHATSKGGADSDEDFQRSVTSVLGVLVQGPIVAAARRPLAELYGTS